MSPRPDGRHCEACGRTVLDLTRATRAEADALVRARRAQGDGRVCARVLRDVATGDEVYRAEPSHGSAPPLRLVAAAALAAACESAYAQGRPPSPPPIAQSPDAGVAPAVDGGRAPHRHAPRHPTPSQAPRETEPWMGDFNEK